jgi:hypothetical protein
MLLTLHLRSSRPTSTFRFCPLTFKISIGDQNALQRVDLNISEPL